MESKIRVMLVEDDPPTQARLIETISACDDIELIAVAGSASEAMGHFYLLDPQVALIDLGLPDKSGVTLIDWLSRNKPHVETMVITAFADEDHVMRALDRGASGYLLKDSSSDELGEHIREVYAGGSPISPMVAKQILFRMQPHRAAQQDLAEPTQVAPDGMLTQKELRVINQVARGFTLAEIAEQMGISRHTVATHVKHIYRKLQVSNQAEAVYEANLSGLISPE